MNKFAVVILAAGKGKRMNSDKLKVMHELKGRPLVDYVVSAVEELKIGLKPLVVVCDDDEVVQNFLGIRAEYVVQKKRLGTGHAVLMAEPVLKDLAENIIVLYGDMPFITTDSLKKLMDKHLAENSKLTLLTCRVEDFEGLQANLFDNGRIIREPEKNFIIKIVEKKDATAEQLKIRELNTAFFCFQAPWLWENLKKVSNNNVQDEYYLTDLVELAFIQGEKLSSVTIEFKEAIGINTIEHLQIAHEI